MLSPEPLIGSQSATNTKLLSEFNTKCIGSKGGGTHKGYLRGADSCRKTNTLSRQLDKGQSRPLDPVHGTGIHAGAAGQPCPVSSSYGGNTLFGRAETHPRRDTKNASERGYHTVNPSRRSAGLLLKHLSSSEEGWRYETSDKPEASQRVHYPTPFQNGGTTHFERPAKEKRLDDQSRSEGCLLYNSNTHLKQTVSPLLCSGISVSVHMPAVRPVQRSLGLYQDPEASDNPAQRARGEVSDIHRRHPSHSGVARVREGTHQGSDIPSGEPGLHCPPREDPVDTHPDNRVPGDGDRFTLARAACSREKTEKNQTGGNQGTQPGASSHNERSVTPTRETVFGVPGYSTRSPVLQSDSEGSGISVRKGQSILQRALSTVAGSKGRTLLVGRSADQMEREKPSSKEPRPTDRVRCLPHRLGSVLRGGTYRRSMVSRGDRLPHKLSGTASSHTSGQDISEGPGKQTHTAVDRQPNSCSLHKQPGRDSLRPGDNSGKEPMDVVPRERNPNHRPVYSGRGKHQGRHRVAGDEGSLRLDAESDTVPTDSKAVPESGDRSIRVPSILPTTEILQLEARSPRGSNGRFPSRLEGTEGLCEPTMESHRPSPVESRGTSDGPSSDSSSLALATVVPQAAQSAGLQPPEDQPSRDGDDRSVGGQSSRDNTTLSRVAYLRQQYADKRISGEATELLLSSWRKKSAQSYDSLCKRWISWCAERNLDPVSGPIEDIVNFLAHLHTQGYQYRSLNSYRSAIASMHAPIEGVSIGQHPLVSRLMKGAFQSRPPLPRYSGTWDIAKVLAYLDGQTLTSSISLKVLTLRTVMLLALTRPSRSADLARLSLAGFKTTPEGAVFVPAALAKQSTANKAIKDFFFPRFTENVRLCPVHSLTLYIERTRQLRGTSTQLFIAIIKPHLPVTTSTVARWLKQVIGDSGIDTNVFKAHSVRGATTSAASNQGVTTEEILKAADWSNSSTFQRFYYKPVRDATFARTVLSVSYKQHN